MINWKGLGRDGRDNYPDICLEELTTTQKTVRRADDQLEIQTGNLSVPPVDPDCCHTHISNRPALIIKSCTSTFVWFHAGLTHVHSE
jgi:hypothetical protein